MTQKEFNDFCASLPATTHIVQWGGADVWKVSGKVFAIGGWLQTDLEKADRLVFSFMTPALNFELLEREPGFRPAHYLASQGFAWVQQSGDTSKSNDELRYYLSESHRLVAHSSGNYMQQDPGLSLH